MSQFTRAESVLELAPPVLVKATTPALKRTTFVQRILKHPHLRHYNRLIALAMAANLVLLTYGLTSGEWWPNHVVALKAIANIAQANFTIAIIFRQPYVINGLHWLATRAPTTWPLKLRWTVAKVYHFGGIHVGTAISGTLWYLLFVSSLTYDAVQDPGRVWIGNLVVSCTLLTLLVVIVVMALPPFRTHAHDLFEAMHRFGGWAALGLVWANTVLFVSSQRGGTSVASVVLTAPTIWMLVVSTTSLALPWLLLRKVAVTIERPSSHVALVRFDHGVEPLVGSVRAISRNPLLGWHSFANFPASVQSPGGYRMAVSRAGDWTGPSLMTRPRTCGCGVSPLRVWLTSTNSSRRWSTSPPAAASARRWPTS